MSVQAYRIFFRDGAGKILHSLDFKASDDEMAIEIAEGRRGLAAMELWSGARLIKLWTTFPPGEEGG